MNLSRCPVCSKRPRIQRYHCTIQNVKMIRIKCSTGCSSTFATKHKDVAFELWNAFVGYFAKNPDKLKKYIK